ncbi:PA domain-containing protein [Chitinophaga costaii]|uniref:PA domain-containing protein n=1 Tax=Chitinophaga costaii TaxID=1335309 RepID=A0A1C4FQQ6_9BACT|nr:M28 family peptidase [Chitinophaga costaii]PUZ20441.1 peptidase M28 [Chitinophaga costaii]SCC57935.1 PA domain-containing protein [Chitinophaga costaii]
MKFKTLFSACLLLATAVHAQMPVRQLSAATPFANTITPAFLESHLRIIASEAMEGRETGTPGQEKAAAYIEEQFKSFGLLPGANGQWRQYYTMYADSLGGHTVLQVQGKSVEYGAGFFGNISRNHGDTLTDLPVVFAGQGIVTDTRDDYKDQDVTGKIVLLLSEDFSFDSSGGKTSHGHFSEMDKVNSATKKGAVAVLLVVDSTRIPKAPSRTGRLGMRRNGSISGANLYLIDVATATLIAGMPPAALAKVSPKVLPNKTSIVFEKISREVKPSNVLAFLEGSDKKGEVLFITGHYDHLGKKGDKIFIGADDDASGTSSVLALAHAFAAAKKAGKGPRRSIVFMTVSGEEEGLLGSGYYTEHPLYPLDSTVVDLNTDMIGRIDPAHQNDTNYVYIIGDNKLSTALRPISEAANKQFTRMALDYTYNDPKDVNRFYYRSDHYMFAQHKIPIIFYFNGVHEDYHRATDTVDKIHFNLMARRSQLVFYTAWDIANREEKLPVDSHEQ